jgi:hypothetical protein
VSRCDTAIIHQPVGGNTGTVTVTFTGYGLTNATVAVSGGAPYIQACTVTSSNTTQLVAALTIVGAQPAGDLNVRPEPYPMPLGLTVTTATNPPVTAYFALTLDLIRYVALPPPGHGGPGTGPGTGQRP